MPMPMVSVKLSKIVVFNRLCPLSPLRFFVVDVADFYQLESIHCCVWQLITSQILKRHGWFPWKQQYLVEAQDVSVPHDSIFGMCSRHKGRLHRKAAPKSQLCCLSGYGASPSLSISGNKTRHTTRRESTNKECEADHCIMHLLKNREQSGQL